MTAPGYGSITNQHEGIVGPNKGQSFRPSLGRRSSMLGSRGQAIYQALQPTKKQTSTKVGNTTTTTTHEPVGSSSDQPQPVAPQPVTPDPRDAQYFENMAKLDFQRKNRIDQLNATGANDQANTTFRLGQMANQHPTDIRNQRVAFNRKGLFESGQLGQAFGDLESKYAAQRGQINSQLAQRADARSQQMAQANSGYSLSSDSELNAARGRAAKALLANPPSDQTAAAPNAGGAPKGQPPGRPAFAPTVATRSGLSPQRAQAIYAALNGKPSGRKGQPFAPKVGRRR